LKCPAYDFTPDDLLAIRQIDKTKTFYECSLLYEIEGMDSGIAKKLANFQMDLNRWRDLSVYTPISEVIPMVFDETGYYNLAGAMPGGLIRQANLRILIEKAGEYENTSFKGLFHFIRYMERLQRARLGTTFGDARSLEQSTDASQFVRIMTIHKSKGLEFPVVFTAMLGRLFNQADERENVILHQALGLGSVYVDTERRIKTNTLPRLALTKKIRLENLSEELRVLYVALTRAKEKLVLVGCVNKLETKIANWCAFADRKDEVLPEFYRAKCQNYLDFIMPCLARHRDGAVIREIAGESANEHSGVFDAPARFEIYLHEQPEIINAKRQNAENKHERIEALRNLKAGQNYSGHE
jgi:ATP-dependent helicase/nuclease subunit A